MLPDVPVPEPWAACPRVRVGEAEVADPRAVTDLLHAAWLDRQPVVVELAADQDALRAPQRHDGPVHHLTPDFEFTVERLQFLVWANTYDARAGEPVWWHGRKAARRFAGRGVAEGGQADLTRSDGTPLFVDGGPPTRRPSTGVGVVHRWNAEAGRLAPGHPPVARHRPGPGPAGRGRTRPVRPG